MLSEKKKRSDLGLHIFFPKSKCSLKKKKGLHSESSSEQTSAANPKLYMLFSRGGPQKKGGLRRLPHSPHPISTTAKMSLTVKISGLKRTTDFSRIFSYFQLVILCNALDMFVMWMLLRMAIGCICCSPYCR